MQRVCESNQLERKAFGHHLAGTVGIYSLSGKICRYRLNDRRLGNSLAQ
jgi:hypothetical protein